MKNKSYEKTDPTKEKHKSSYNMITYHRIQGL